MLLFENVATLAGGVAILLAIRLLSVGAWLLLLGGAASFASGIATFVGLLHVAQQVLLAARRLWWRTLLFLLEGMATFAEGMITFTRECAYFGWGDGYFCKRLGDLLGA